MTKLEKLQTALIEGEESGPSKPLDIEAFIARKRGSMAKVCSNG
jgi:Arc/MetJ-type ribon-helix-helix transcriptional regulator